MEPVIQEAEVSQRLAALQLVCAADDDVDQSARLLAECIDRGELDGRGLFVYAPQQQVEGSILCQVLPGNAGAVWPPRTTNAHEARSINEQLLTVALGWLHEQQITFVQSLIRPYDQVAHESLEGVGFERMADLLYLVWLAPEHAAPSMAAACELTFQSISSADQERLARLIQLTYDGTLDCPALNGRRCIEDVLEGYRHTGVYSSERWLIVQHEHEDVGCLLLTDHPHTAQWELMYMGLVPAARGRGWGWKLVQHAMRLTAAAGRRALAVAVDSENLPALGVYRGCGFLILDSRRVMLRATP